MELGMIGLGRMGANMALRLMRGGHQRAGFDPKPEARKDLEDKGAESADSLATRVAKLPATRTLWLMVPAGEITDGILTNLLPLPAAGDTVIDGGHAIKKERARVEWPIVRSVSSQLTDASNHQADLTLAAAPWRARRRCRR